MKKVRGILLVSTIAILVAPPAALSASQPGFYVGLGAGPDFMPDRGLSIDGSAGGQNFSIPTTSKWKTGWGAFITAGYRWDNGLRAEAEYSFREQKVEAFDHTPWSGTQWDNSLMANLYYDIDTGTAITPYLGAGIGGAHLSWGDNFRPTGTSIIYDGSGVNFAWQAIVGAAYAVTPRLDLSLDFRFKGSGGDYTFPSTSGVTANKFDYMTRTLVFSIHYSIGE
jgi:OOP family OmpA-OmpF porin